MCDWEQCHDGTPRLRRSLFAAFTVSPRVPNFFVNIIPIVWKYTQLCFHFWFTLVFGSYWNAHIVFMLITLWFNLNTFQKFIRDCHSTDLLLVWQLLGPAWRTSFTCWDCLLCWCALAQMIEQRPGSRFLGSIHWYGYNFYRVVVELYDTTFGTSFTKSTFLTQLLLGADWSWEHCEVAIAVSLSYKYVKQQFRRTWLRHVLLMLPMPE